MKTTIVVKEASKKVLNAVAKKNAAIIAQAKKAQAASVNQKVAKSEAAEKARVKVAKENASLVGQIEKLGCAVSEYKGKPILVLDPEREPQFLRTQFGESKAHVIREKVKAIELFCEFCDRQK
jgi:hypothetical protein